MSVTVRPAIVTWAHWFVEHQPQIAYEEVRPFPLGAKLPMDNDCSATFTDCYYLAGAPDPNGPAYHYDGYGNTDSLAANGQGIAQSQILPGDAVIYYGTADCAPGTTEHVAMVITPGDDPMTMSHGWSGEPAYVTVNSDGRPHRFFRFAVNSRFPAPPPKPVPPVPKGKPTAAELSKNGLVRLLSHAAVRKAVTNGWTLWYWAETKFEPQIGHKPVGVPLYANRLWREKRP